MLIVDDEWNMRNLLRIYLQKEGFTIKEAATGHEALALVKTMAFDMVLLDVMMPDMDGWEVCKRVREVSTVPILMLTARSETKDKVRGLGMGADDYLTKPFEPEELLARVHSLIRRSSITQVSLPQPSVLDFTCLRIYPEGREILIQDQVTEFTQKEFDLLLVLAQSRHRAFTREELVEWVWGNDYTGESRVVDTHVKNIREKVQRAGLGYNPIQTIWGLGYRFHEPGEVK
ncbi:MAG: response regulator transcription factor [Gorillibacterium sp.]|nr:response regulator transcription factor [Gorillibacterium sp.]